MRVIVDNSKCDGYGTCFEMCPSTFRSDDWGYAAAIGDGTVPARDEALARRVIGLCGQQAIREI